MSPLRMGKGKKNSYSKALQTVILRRPKVRGTTKTTNAGGSGRGFVRSAAMARITSNQITMQADKMAADHLTDTNEGYGHGIRWECTMSSPTSPQRDSASSLSGIAPPSYSPAIQPRSSSRTQSHDVTSPTRTTPVMNARSARRHSTIRSHADETPLLSSTSRRRPASMALPTESRANSALASWASRYVADAPCEVDALGEAQEGQALPVKRWESHVSLAT